MRKLLTLLAVLSLAVSAASAQTVEWHGVNTSFATSLADDDIYNENLWFDPATEASRLPTADDEAYLNFNSTSFARDDLSLIENPDPQGDDFIARKLTMIGYTSTAPLYVRMNLSLDSIYLRMGGNWSGGDQNLRIGAADTQAQLALRKADIIAAAGGDVTITGLASANLSLAGLSEDFVTRRSEIMSRINALTTTTGVAAKQPPNWSLGNPTENIIIYATTFGSTSLVQIEPQSGSTFRTSGLVSTGEQYLAVGIGFSENTLTLTGPVPVDLASDRTGDIRTKWGTIRLYPGSSIVFTNPAITLIQQTQAVASSNPPGSASAGPIDGTDGTVEFAAVGGSIELQNPGIRSDGVLNVGQHMLKIRSDQTFSNPTGLGFIRMGASTAGHVMVATSDAGNVDLGNVPLVLDTHINDNASGSLSGGVYEGLHIRGSNGASRRYTFFYLDGDITLDGFAVAVTPDNAASGVVMDTQYSLRSYLVGGQRAQVRLNGNTLTTANGILLSHVGTGSMSNNTDGVQIDVGSSTLNIGGNLFYDCDNPLRLADGSEATRYIGVTGNPDATVNLQGNFSSRLRSLSSYNGTTTLTVNMTGGTAVAPAMLEVMGGPNDGFQLGTASFGELTIGDGVAPNVVKLINEFATMVAPNGRAPKSCW